MKYKRCFVILLLSVATFANARAQESVQRILFGSCIKQDQPTPIFQTMLGTPADLTLFLGDNIYADTSDVEEMRSKYAKLAANPLFDRLRKAAPCLATWDDHDYGINDGGADFVAKQGAQAAFLDFWKVPIESPLRKREGIYDSRVFGEMGERLQVILLDTRYFRSPLKKGPRRVGGPYVPDLDESKTILGTEQWKWLETQLQQPAELRLLVTSIQCVAEAAGQETWSNLPLERQRLFDLIQSTRASGVILISGDRHWSELSMTSDDTPYPMFELTCSSFNQLHARGTPTQNRYRVMPTTYHRENYGEITIDWKAEEPSVSLRIRDMEANVRLEKTIQLRDLQAE